MVNGGASHILTRYSVLQFRNPLRSSGSRLISNHRNSGVMSSSVGHYRSSPNGWRAPRARIAPIVMSGSGGCPVSSTGSLRPHSGIRSHATGTLLAQPVARVTAGPRAIARLVGSFGPTCFSVSRRGVLAYQAVVNRSQFIWVDRTANASPLPASRHQCAALAR